MTIKSGKITKIESGHPNGPTFITVNGIDKRLMVPMQDWSEKYIDLNLAVDQTKTFTYGDSVSDDRYVCTKIE